MLFFLNFSQPTPPPPPQPQIPHLASNGQTPSSFQQMARMMDSLILDNFGPFAFTKITATHRPNVVSRGSGEGSGLKKTPITASASNLPHNPGPYGKVNYSGGKLGSQGESGLKYFGTLHGGKVLRIEVRKFPPSYPILVTKGDGNTFEFLGQLSPTAWGDLIACRDSHDSNHLAELFHKYI